MNLTEEEKRILKEGKERGTVEKIFRKEFLQTEPELPAYYKRVLGPQMLALKTLPKYSLLACPHIKEDQWHKQSNI